ncbi:hypothetical protein L3i20_v213060 [Paenibacillus sp. L3-i20]|nr:hypothetical protein L3i20_v213060 [Paenibacillus sp. L3-i20]
MKKSLSLLVAIAMVFSMFATVVSAAEETKSAGEFLKELGVIKGNAEGDLKEDQTWKRQDIIVLLSRLLGKEEVAKATKKSHTFTDVTDKGYDGYISWAVENKLTEGKGNNKFGFGSELKNQEFFAFVIRAFGAEVAYADIPAAAIKYGFATDKTDMAGIPLRGATYDVIVTALNTEVPGKGQTLGEVLGLIVSKEVTASVTQTGVKQATVQFNKAVDTTKVKFVVKNGIATRDVVKTTFAEDKKSVVLDLASKLLKGDSTVTVTGANEKEIVAKFETADEKITEIQFTNDKVALVAGNDYKKVAVGYKVVNQFNENVTKTAGGSLSFQVGKAGTTASHSAKDGIVTLTSTGTFVLGESVYVSAILNLNTYGVTATKTFTVGPEAMVDSVDVLSVYHATNKELMTNSAFADFYLLVDAKDQYGNAVTLAQFKAGVFAVANNASLFTVNKDHAVSGVGPNNDKIGIPLTAPATGVLTFDGTNTVRVTTLFGQKSDSLDVVVKKASVLTNFTLEQPEAVSINKTVKIPFTALDQNGNAVKKYSEINGKITLYASNGNDKISLKQNYSTKEAYIEWVAPSVEGANFVGATVVGTPNNSQLQINVVAAGNPEAVVGLKDIGTNVHVGGTVKIEAKHIIVKDQFGRDVKLNDVISTHKVVISAADGTANVLGGFGEITTKDGFITLTGTAKGNERIKLSLVKLAAGTVAEAVISEYDGHVIAVIDNDSIESYEVTTSAKISKQTADSHNVAVEVKGKRTDGSTVTLPTSAYTVTPATAGLKYDGAKLNAGDVVVGNDGTAKAKYVVFVTATSTSLEKEIIVTNEALIPTTIEQQNYSENGTVVLTAEDLVVKGDKAKVNVATVFNTLKIKDQFGVEMNSVTAGEFTASISDLDDVAKGTGSLLLEVVNQGGVVGSAAVNNIEAGDSYSVTFTSKLSGKPYKVKVVATS